MRGKAIFSVITCLIFTFFLAGNGVAGDSTSYSGKSNIETQTTSPVTCDWSGSKVIGKVAKGKEHCNGATACSCGCRGPAYKTRYELTELVCKNGNISELKTSYTFGSCTCYGSCWCP